MNYKAGDRFVLTIGEEIQTDSGPLFRVKGFNALVFDNHGLNKLQRLEPLHIEEPPVTVRVVKDQSWRDRIRARWAELTAPCPDEEDLKKLENENRVLWSRIHSLEDELRRTREGEL